MKLTAIITKEEIVHILSDLTPLEIGLGKKRSVTFGTPELVELVPKTGLRVRGDAKMIWDVAGMPLPVTLRAWQLLLVPSIVRRDGALVLAFEPTLEELDFKRIPGFFDERIADAVNEGVASQRKKLSWNLTRVLGSRSALPKRVTRGGSFDITPSDASVAVTASELRVVVELDARVSEDASRDGEVTPRSLRSA